jgi:hypothetical protein
MKSIFKETFSAFHVCEGDTITAEAEGFTLTARVETDQTAGSPEDIDEGFWPPIDPESAGYIGNKSKAKLAQATKRANEVPRAWQADEWFYGGIGLSVSKTVELSDGTSHTIVLVDAFPSGSQIEVNRPYASNSELNLRADEESPEAIELAKKIVERLYGDKHDRVLKAWNNPLHLDPEEKLRAIFDELCI